jgi:AcrR family transcriptional regulator
VSTRPTNPALGARYDRRRGEVLVEAARVFARHGYAETSVQQLSEELGIAAGGLYHYFESKQHLLVAICEQIMDPLLDRARELVDGPTPLGEQLRPLVRLWVSQVTDRRDHMLVFQQQRHVIDGGRAWREVRRSRKAFEGLVDDVLAREEAAGRMAGDRRLVLSALLGMVNHTAQWYRPRGALSPQEIADGYVELLVGRGGSRG